nr:glycosyl transferase family 1 [Streptomyces sp. DSM 41633]
MTAGRGSLSVTLCRDFREFGALAGEWDALHRRCATATPFQSHAWLHSWWISYGQEGRLRVLLVRRSGRLIGAAPLMLAHRPMPLLVPMGGAISDFFDILLDEEEAGYAVGALQRGLDRAARHAVIDLREVRPDASAQLLFGRW